MSHSHELIMSPGVHSVADLVAENNGLKASEASEILGMKESRVKKIGKKLENKDLMTIETTRNSIKMYYTAENKEKIKDILNQIEKERKSMESSLLNSLRELNQFIISQKPDNSTESDSIENIQQSLFSAVEKIEEGDYLEADKQLSDINENDDLDHENLDKEKLHGLRSREKAIQKWGLPK